MLQRTSQDLIEANVDLVKEMSCGYKSKHMYQKIRLSKGRIVGYNHLPIFAALFYPVLPKWKEFLKREF